MLARELVQRYYTSLQKRDNTWQELYSDDAVFSDASNTLNARGRNAVIQSFVPFLKSVAGVKVTRMIAEGNHVCTVIGYEYVNPKGAKMSQDVAEIWEVKDGKLARLTIYFDLTAYRSFMRG